MEVKVQTSPTRQPSHASVGPEVDRWFKTTQGAPAEVRYGYTLMTEEIYQSRLAETHSEKRKQAIAKAFANDKVLSQAYGIPLGASYSTGFVFSDTGREFVAWDSNGVALGKNAEGLPLASNGKLNLVSQIAELSNPVPPELDQWYQNGSGSSVEICYRYTLMTKEAYEKKITGTDGEIKKAALTRSFNADQALAKAYGLSLGDTFYTGYSGGPGEREFGAWGIDGKALGRSAEGSLLATQSEHNLVCKISPVDLTLINAAPARQKEVVSEALTVKLAGGQDNPEPQSGLTVATHHVGSGIRPENTLSAPVTSEAFTKAEVVLGDHVLSPRKGQVVSEKESDASLAVSLQEKTGLPPLSEATGASQPPILTKQSATESIAEVVKTNTSEKLFDLLLRTSRNLTSFTKRMVATVTAIKIGFLGSPVQATSLINTAAASNSRKLEIPRANLPALFRSTTKLGKTVDDIGALHFPRPVIAKSEIPASPVVRLWRDENSLSKVKKEPEEALKGDPDTAISDTQKKLTKTTFEGLEELFKITELPEAEKRRRRAPVRTDLAGLEALFGIFDGEFTRRPGIKASST